MQSPSQPLRASDLSRQAAIPKDAPQTDRGGPYSRRDSDGWHGRDASNDCRRDPRGLRPPLQLHREVEIRGNLADLAILNRPRLHPPELSSVNYSTDLVKQGC